MFDCWVIIKDKSWKESVQLDDLPDNYEPFRYHVRALGGSGRSQLNTDILLLSSQNFYFLDPFPGMMHDVTP